VTYAAETQAGLVCFVQCWKNVFVMPY